MKSSEQIICKPTPWFLFRAGAMLAMFGVFSVLFYIDGTTGYRKKNLGYYLHATFQEASTEFSRMNSGGKLTPAKWQEHVAEQTVAFPSDPSVIPIGTKLPMAWPPILANFEKMKSLQPHLLWQEYSGENQLNQSPPEKAFDAKKIREQIIVFYICLALTAATLFFLIRTLSRSIVADNDALRVHGKKIPYEHLKSIDLRKWDTKGIALVEYEGSSGKGRLRIDGLTYGGFKKEQEEPAERLMHKIRENFSGEIIEYAAEQPLSINRENEDPT